MPDRLEMKRGFAVTGAVMLLTAALLSYCDGLAKNL
jgi:hypothetical protein